MDKSWGRTAVPVLLSLTAFVCVINDLYVSEIYHNVPASKQCAYMSCMGIFALWGVFFSVLQGLWACVAQTEERSAGGERSCCSDILHPTAKQSAALEDEKTEREGRRTSTTTLKNTVTFYQVPRRVLFVI